MTVEAAIALGTLVLVAAAVIASVASVLASIRCVDAARELARAASRGETERGRTAAARIAPSGAQMDVRVDGEEVVVRVAAAPVGLLPIEVTGTATGLMEPGVVRAVTPPVPDSAPEDEPGDGSPSAASPSAVAPGPAASAPTASGTARSGPVATDAAAEDGARREVTRSSSPRSAAVGPRRTGPGRTPHPGPAP